MRLECRRLDQEGKKTVIARGDGARSRKEQGALKEHARRGEHLEQASSTRHDPTLSYLRQWGLPPLALLIPKLAKLAQN